MRYFQISNGLHGCLWDYSFAVPCHSIKELADALQDCHETLCGEDEVALTDADALSYARECWHSTGYLPISLDVGDGNYCMACEHCTPEEARALEEAYA